MQKTNTAARQRFTFTVAPKFGVDAKTGKLTNLQLMAAGREAKGHGIYIDEQTLVTAKAAVDARGGRLKAYATHNHGGPCSSTIPDMADPANELNIPGFFSRITTELRTTPPQLVAGEFEFYDAFRKNFAPQYEQLLEMAQKTPDLLGLSVECWGYGVYVAVDGTEYSGLPDGVALRYNGVPALRVTDIWAAAFVSDPAATDGLFARFSALFGGKHRGADRAELAAALLRFATEFAESEPDTVPAAALGNETTSEKISLSEISTMKIIADLKAKITDPQRFAAAMAIVGNTPADKLASLTAGHVEAVLVAQERESNLAGAAAVDPNPWAAATRNLTRQCEITKANPTRAAALKAAATPPTNPFAVESLNLTEQALLLKNDPARAASLKAEAQGGDSNPWAEATRNLTRQCELVKTNPVKAAAFKAAAFGQ